MDRTRLQKRWTLFPAAEVQFGRKNQVFEVIRFHAGMREYYAVHLHTGEKVTVVFALEYEKRGGALLGREGEGVFEFINDGLIKTGGLITSSSSIPRLSMFFATSSSSILHFQFLFHLLTLLYPLFQSLSFASCIRVA
jgi:hypothetical protein